MIACLVRLNAVQVVSRAFIDYKDRIRKKTTNFSSIVQSFKI